jgi:hypothetical protein
LVGESISSQTKKGLLKGIRKGRKRSKSRKKRGMNGYIIFCEEVRKKNPRVLEDLSFTERGRKLGKLWRELSESKKHFYNNQAKKKNSSR